MNYLKLFAFIALASTAVAAPKKKDILTEQQRVLSAAKAEVSKTGASLSSARNTIASQKGYISSLKKEVATVVGERDKAVSEVEKLKTEVDKLKKKVLQTGRERDVFIVAFTIMGVITLFGLLRPFLALIPPPYSYAAYIASPIVLFFLLFYAARLALQLLVKIIF